MQDHREHAHWVLGYILCDLDPKINVTQSIALYPMSMCPMILQSLKLLHSMAYAEMHLQENKLFDT